MRKGILFLVAGLLVMQACNVSKERFFETAFPVRAWLIQAP